MFAAQAGAKHVYAIDMSVKAYYVLSCAIPTHVKRRATNLAV
jgi:hypothetical protein